MDSILGHPTWMIETTYFEKDIDEIISTKISFDHSIRM